MRRISKNSCTTMLRGVIGLVVVVIILAPVSSPAALTIEVSPKEVFVGETARLVIQSDRAVPTVSEVPTLPAVEWLGGGLRNQQRTIINGESMFRGSLALPFRVQAEGTVVIPSFEVTVDGETHQTDPVEVVAKRRTVATGGGGEATLEELFFARVRVGTGEATVDAVYVGEEVPIVIDVYMSDRLDVRGLGFPEIEVENGAFRDFSKRNPQAPRFFRADETRRIEDGLAFRVVTFEARLTPTGPGTLTGGGRVVATFGMRRERPRTIPGRPDPFDPAFFDEFFGSRTLQQPTSFTIPATPVRPLPPPPSDAGVVLGLVGDWNLDASLSKSEVPEGEPVSLTLQAEGGGNPHAFEPPDLSVPGFRVHGPEVVRGDGIDRSQVKATWVLVPEGKNVKLGALKFSIFDPATKTYRTSVFDLPLTVTRSERPTPTGSAVAGAKDNEGDGQSAKSQTQHDILYLKTRVGANVVLPLWQRRLLFDTAIVLIGGMVLVAGCMVRIRRERFAVDESLRRRDWARRNRSRLLRRLKHSSGAQRATLIREEIVPWLAALRGLPPGATARDVADTLKYEDDTLATMILEAEHSAYVPGGSNVAENTLLKRLRRLNVWVLLCGVAIVLGANAGRAADSSISTDPFDAAVTAYDEGRFELAYEGFNAAIDRHGETPNLLYNLANCAYQMGDRSEALAKYQRALRLAPRDPDILGNLEFVRHQVGLPPLHDPQNPRQLVVELRDRLRPDEWLTLACLLLGAALAFAGVRLATARRGSGVIAAVLAGVAAICCVAVVLQYRTTYRSESHAVAAGGVTPLTAPSELAEPVEAMVVRGGENVRVLERRGDWRRIRIGQAEGWVQRDNLFIVW